MNNPIETKKRRRVHPLLIAIGLILLIRPSLADDRDSNENALLKYSLGFITSYAIHEGAHALTAALTDTEIHWETGIYNQPLGFKERADSDTDGLLLNASGLLSQVIGSEIILNYDRIDKKNKFIRGIMVWNIINPIIYAMDYWYLGNSNKDRKNSYQGDIKGVEYYSDKNTANQFALSMALLSAYQAYRFYKMSFSNDPHIENQFMPDITPLSSNGISIRFSVSF